jgi:hypothetical protein
MRATLLLGTVMVLAGCAVPNGPTNLVATRALPRPDVEAPPAQGETSVVVRAFTVAGAELAGIVCSVESPYVATEMTAPGRVMMPDYGSQAPVVSVSCMDGESSGAVQVAPQTGWERGLYGWPSVGFSVGSEGGVGMGVGWYGGSATTGTPALRYPEARVVLN